MDVIVDILVEHELLLLFLISAAGYAIGRISFGGIKLGVAAVLFVGLAMGALDDSISLPSFVISIGLVLFVYTIGIASGASFVASFKKNGLRDSGVVISLLVAGALFIVIAGKLLGLDSIVATGLYTGAYTNTPALAGVVQILEKNQLGDTSALAGLPAVGYSVAYPMGVLGPILAIAYWQKRYRIKYKEDAKKAKNILAAGAELNNISIKITNKSNSHLSINSLRERFDWPVVFARIKRGNRIILADDYDVSLEENDIVSVIGTSEDIQPVIDTLGKQVKLDLALDRKTFNFRRVFVSDKTIIGKSIGELKIPQKFGALVTRVRRGDVDMVAHNNFILEYGDRVRFVSRKNDINKVSKFFGDSYKSISDLHFMSFGAGISLGLLVGMIPIYLPGGIVFRLGEAGGPLVVGLLLSYFKRIGPFVWTISYSANHVLREFGLVLMLAGIGVRSGSTFISGLQASNGMELLAIGAIASIAIPMIFIPLAYKKFKLPFAVVTGMVSAIHTQPAVTGYANQQAGNDLPTHGYVGVFPVATITKLIVAQVLLIVLI